MPRSASSDSPAPPDGPARPRPFRWLAITGAVLGAAVLLAIAALAVTVILANRSYARAYTARLALDAAHGGYDSYRPAADGTVPADRMARFLAVRGALQPRCAEVAAATEPFRQVEQMAKSQGGEADVPSLFGLIWTAARQVPSMGAIFGGYVEARNAALTAGGMGLGEYTWIYAAAYFGALGQAPVRVLERQGEPSLFEARVFPAVARAMRRHVDALGASEAAATWADELARLEHDPSRVPFAAGLPPELAASLAPHRAALAAVACPAAAELDLTITVPRQRFGYDHR